MARESESMQTKVACEVNTFLLNAYKDVIEALPGISEWLTSFVTWQAVFWFLLGLSTLPLVQRL